MTSEAQIEKWKRLIEFPGGRERLSAYICSLTLGRDFGETVDAYFARRGLQEFITWANTVVK